MPGLLENDLLAPDRQPVDRDDDPYTWALEQAALLRRPTGSGEIDAGALAEFLEEWAAEMLAAVRSHLVNLMAHAAKTALSRNPNVIGHWRSECVEFHDRLVEAYRPSMRARIDMPALWKRACRKVAASFADHGETAPSLPADCPFALDELIDADLDLDWLVARVTAPQ
ncbi:MAG: DUF29 family protein [Alphaproteobacteria bacterium]